MKCPNCGCLNRSGASSCERCGAALAVSEFPPTPTPVAQPLSLSWPTPMLSNPPTDTSPLPSVSAAFAPLPEGALLKHRYIIREVLSSGPRINVYLIEDLFPVRQCPNCGIATSTPQERFCISCGADLSSVPETHFRYRVQESSDVQVFSPEAQLLEMNLGHPGLILPIAIFTYTPYGSPRQYRLEPEFLASPASALPIPQEILSVLEWGVLLAQTMGYLHQHQVVLRSVNLDHISIDDTRAFWMHTNPYCIPPESRSASAEAFAQNVKNLAVSLLYLATGEQPHVALSKLSSPLQGLFSRVIAEPQGMTAFSFAEQLDAAFRMMQRPETIALRVGYCTDVGQVRSLNEDSLLVLDALQVYRSVNQPLGLFAVADGMGGHEAGDVASQLTCRAIGRLFAQEVVEPVLDGQVVPDMKSWLNAAVQAANRAVYDQRLQAGSDMGNTLVMAFLNGNFSTLANIGDSRCYHLREDGIIQITRDHSLVERLVEMGQITEEEAIHHLQKNVIYRVIGDKPKVEVDLYELTLQTGEALLLCSDGLSGMVSTQHIWEIWKTSVSPQDACDRLAEAANQASGEDNITVIIVQVIS